MFMLYRLLPCVPPFLLLIMPLSAKLLIAAVTDLSEHKLNWAITMLNSDLHQAYKEGQ